MKETEPTRPLEDQLVEKLREWLVRTAPRIRDDTECASIVFTLMHPAFEDDDTPYLEARIEEKCNYEDLGGTIPEVKP